MDKWAPTKCVLFQEESPTLKKRVIQKKTCHSKEISLRNPLGAGDPPPKKKRVIRKEISKFPHETTVTPNLNDISAGIKIIPAKNSTGHLFGRDLFTAIPRLQMARKVSKTSVGVVAKDACLFFYHFHKIAYLGR